MAVADIPAARDVLDRAFNGQVIALTGRGRLPYFGEALLPHRLAADPEGALVAEQDGRLVGALGSAWWGTVAWFGPVGVEPQRQRIGAGRALVGAWMDCQRGRGVQLLGLETWAQSGGHLRLYGSLGFQPLWLSAGMSLTVPPGPHELPPGVQRFSALAPREQRVALDALAGVAGRVYLGMDWRREILAAASTGSGDALLLAGGEGIAGLAVCHTGTLVPHIDRLLVSLLAVDPEAGGEAPFLRLLDGVEALARILGCKHVHARVCTRFTAAHAALRARGFRDDGAMARLKQGAHLEYERPDLYLLDSWL